MTDKARFLRGKKCQPEYEMPAHRFRTRLVFKQYDVILTKKQSLVTKIRSSFEGENMQTRYSVLRYRVDLYCHEYELTIEIDENRHDCRNIEHEIKRQKQ